MKCNESSEDICLSKICSAFQTACSHVTAVRSVSGTHKAQEIKAVNKGPSDKGSPDSYESRAGRGLAAGSFRTRADGHEKTNHSDEHEGHHLHLALSIQDFLFFSFSLLPSFIPLYTFSLLCIHPFCSFLFYFGNYCISHYIQVTNKTAYQEGLCNLY